MVRIARNVHNDRHSARLPEDVLKPRRMPIIGTIAELSDMCYTLSMVIAKNHELGYSHINNSVAEMDGHSVLYLWFYSTKNSNNVNKAAKKNNRSFFL